MNAPTKTLPIDPLLCPFDAASFLGVKRQHRYQGLPGQDRRHHGRRGRGGRTAKGDLSGLEGHLPNTVTRECPHGALAHSLIGGSVCAYCVHGCRFGKGFLCRLL